MPFGLQGAPATFQRLMDKLLKDTRDFAAVYLDDVVIFSESWEDHLHRLHQVLQRIKPAGLTINLSHVPWPRGRSSTWGSSLEVGSSSTLWKS